ncbi:MAG TPA: GNAT family N-acetyltransferase [Methylomirabilota bacterium]
MRIRCSASCRLVSKAGSDSGKLVAEEESLDHRELRIRRARSGDSERLTQIARAAKAHWGYPEAWLSAWRPILRITPEYAERQLVYLAALDPETVGFYALEPRGAGWSLEHFWIDPRWHRRGVGRSMFLDAVDRIRAIRPGIMVIEADPHAAGFYARMGGRRNGTVPAPVEGDPGRTLPVFEIDVRKEGVS